eukprot:4118530-Alexandrium_andersonii.AAC.1
MAEALGTGPSHRARPGRAGRSLSSPAPVGLFRELGPWTVRIHMVSSRRCPPAAVARRAALPRSR